MSFFKNAVNPTSGQITQRYFHSEKKRLLKAIADSTSHDENSRLNEELRLLRIKGEQAGHTKKTQATAPVTGIQKQAPRITMTTGDLIQKYVLCSHMLVDFPEEMKDFQRKWMSENPSLVKLLPKNFNPAVQPTLVPWSFEHNTEPKLERYEEIPIKGSAFNDLENASE